MWLTLPVTLKVKVSPADSVRPGTRTGDSAGAESPELAVEPFGIPANQGSEVPGTTTALAAPISPNTIALTATQKWSSDAETFAPPDFYGSLRISMQYYV